MRSLLRTLATALLACALLILLQHVFTVLGADQVALRVGGGVAAAGLVAGLCTAAIMRPTAAQGSATVILVVLTWALLGAWSRVAHGYGGFSLWGLLWWIVAAVTLSLGLIAGCRVRRWVGGGHDAQPAAS